MKPVSQTDSDVPPPMSELVRQLIDETRAYIEAEREIYGIQARITRRATGWVALYALGAVVIAQGAMIALVVGILLVLLPMIGAGWATLVIVSICTGATALMIWLIRLKLRSVQLAWRRRNDG